MSAQPIALNAMTLVSCPTCSVGITVKVSEAAEIIAAFMQSHDSVWIRPFVPIQRPPTE